LEFMKRNIILECLNINKFSVELIHKYQYMSNCYASRDSFHDSEAGDGLLELLC